jgi:3-methylfumaryl-CoA hydratase
MSNLNLQDWLGKTESAIDNIYPTPIKALAKTLDYKSFNSSEGNILPELWYWLYFLPMVTTSDIGNDGHPKRGGFLPPIKLERRMWAGSRLTFKHNLIIGEEIKKDSEIIKITEKNGNAGSMVFITVKHRIKSVRGIAIEEEQDIVYLNKARSFTPPAPIPLPEDLQWHENYDVGSILLFRFSALTFNSHKIHYDWKYVTEEEKYPSIIRIGKEISSEPATIKLYI